MFNEEQRDYMRELDTIPAKELCWCGWYRWGHCYNCRRYNIVGTAADKVAAKTFPGLTVGLLSTGKAGV